MSAITLGAPIAGWAMPLAEVPDAVFADAMMGPGVAIDPLGDMIRSPCDATVGAVASTGHSVTLTLDNGAELLIHVGIDTVKLAGAGFEAKVLPGARVTAGAPLIALDLDRIARGCSSLVTPIVIASEGYDVAVLATAARVAAGDPILSVTPVATQVAAPVGDDTAACEVVVPLANGIHARPAARLVAALKPLAAEVRCAAHGREADAKSPIGWLTLAAKHGDTIALTARGADARAAVAAIVALIEGGMGEAGPPPAAVAPVRRGPVRAAPGLAIGPAFRFVVPEIAVAERGAGIAVETASLDAARASVAAELDRTGSAIAAAHRAILDDPALAAVTRTAIASGDSAGQAWRSALRDQAAAFRATGDARLAERAADLLDLERRVLAALSGEAPTAPDAPPGAILIAEDLLPSQFLALDPSRVAGIALAAGGPTSHVAILAAAAGVPMLVACGPALLDVPDGTTILLDADAVAIDIAPTPDRLTEARARIAATRDLRTAALARSHEACETADGTRIHIYANLGSLADAHAAIAAGAEGCGLLRTEFLFLDRATAPDEDEQADAYAAIAAALDGRPLIVRTLDIGGDKPVAYLPSPREDNPALGARGIRLGLARPDLLAVQLRAILRGVPPRQCRIMLPMIVDAGELAIVRAQLETAASATGRPVPPLGVMIETPAAAVLAESLARDAAFLSVGSNDLTQYALAADRGNAAVADRVDALHPAVLRLIAEAGKGAGAHGRWLGVCGALASDPAAAPLLIGLGVTELSATPAAIPMVKAAVRATTLADARALATRALACATAREVRALMERS